MQLGDFVTLQRGHDLPGERRQPGHVPILGSFGITGWHNQAKAQGPGVTVGRSGASFGVVSYSPVDFWPLNTALYVVDFHGNDPRFAYYLLRTIDFQSYNSGSAQPSLNRNFVHPIPIDVPPVFEQRAIAHILATLDDRIEANRRMNEMLEGIARAIFKSWFINFDPVRDKVEGCDSCLAPEVAAIFPNRLVESESGEVPEGWAQATFEEVAKPGTDVVQPEELLPDEPYIGLEHMPRRSIALAEWGVAAELSSHKVRFRQGDILFGKLRPYFHKVGIALIDGVCSTDIVVLRPTAKDFGALVLFVASSDAFVAFNDIASTGTKMPRTSWSRMREYSLTVPDAAVANSFEQYVTPMLDRIRLGVLHSRTLTALRDLLLPKLMSGEIRVQDAERLLEESGG
jgi:type I restriction enzyme S subunit